MWQARLYGAGDLRFEEAPLDLTLGPLDFFAETDVSALSTGTDLGNYSGGSTYVPGAPDYPRWVGYSNVAIVRMVGAEVTRVKPGDRVFTNQPHRSAFVSPESRILATIPANVPSDQASLLYLTNLGLHSLQKADFRPGADVAILGLGVIGLCTVALARALGAADVIAIANSAERAELASKLGATESVDVSTPEGRARVAHVRDALCDIVVLTANPWAAYRDAMEVVRRFGHVSILGFPGRGESAPDFNPMAPEWVYRKQLSVHGAGLARDVPANMEYLVRLMAQGRLNLGPAISHRIPAGRMVEAYEMAASRLKQMSAAVFDWSGFHGMTAT